MSFLPCIGKRPAPTLDTGRHEDIQLYAINETIKRTKEVIDGLDITSINQLYWLDLRCGDEELRAIYFPGDSSPTPLSNRIVELGGENWFSDVVGSRGSSSTLKLRSAVVHTSPTTGQSYATTASVPVWERRATGNSPFTIVRICTIGDGACEKAQADYSRANHLFSRTNSLALGKAYISRASWDALVEQESKNPLVSRKLNRCQAVFTAFDSEMSKVSSHNITLTTGENNFRSVIYGITLQVLEKNSTFAKYNMLLKTLDNDDEKPDLVIHILYNVVREISANTNLGVVTDFSKWKKGIITKQWDTSKVAKHLRDA